MMTTNRRVRALEDGLSPSQLVLDVMQDVLSSVTPEQVRERLVGTDEALFERLNRRYTASRKAQPGATTERAIVTHRAFSHEALFRSTLIKVLNSDAVNDFYARSFLGPLLVDVHERAAILSQFSSSPLDPDRDAERLEALHRLNILHSTALHLVAGTPRVAALLGQWYFRGKPLIFAGAARQFGPIEQVYLFAQELLRLHSDSVDGFLDVDIDALARESARMTARDAARETDRAMARLIDPRP